MKCSKSKPTTIVSRKSKLTDILSSLCTQRCLSAKHSPYQNQTSIERLKLYLESSSRIQSPAAPLLSSTFKKPSKNPKKNSYSKKRRNTDRTKKIKDLVELNTATSLKYAPKIYENQFFYDVYDNKNNHDRVLITPKSSISQHPDDSLLINAKFIILPNMKNSETQSSDFSVHPPQSSYLEDPASPLPLSDLLPKLELLSSLQ